MPPARPFAITASKPGPLDLGQSRRGSVSFTVTNEMRRPVRARVTIEPEGNTRREWLAVAGEVEREYTADGTQTCTIEINLPEDAPGGEYPFHIQVATTSNPDDEYTHGPPHTFRVAATEPKKPFPWWIVAVVGGVVAVAAIVLAIVLTQKPGVLKACTEDGECAAELACIDLDGKPTCLVNLGGECSADAECNGSFVSCTESGKKSVCTALLVGDPCEEGACPESMTCTGDKCLFVDGTSCGAPEQCASGSCTDGNCATPVALGDVCPADGTCPTGMACSGGKCLGALGYKGCTSKSQCLTASCSATSGLCTSLLGANCTTSSQCESTATGLECKILSAGSGACKGSIGTSCEKDDDCAKAWCAGAEGSKICANPTQTCTTSKDCKSGFDCVGNKCGVKDGGPCTSDDVCISPSWCKAGKCDACDTRCGKDQYCSHDTCLQEWSISDVMVSTDVYLYVKDEMLMTTTSAATTAAGAATTTTSGATRTSE